MDLLGRIRDVLWITLVVFVRALSQISPGELSSAHENLNAVDKCTSCHERASEISNQKCLSCHTNIKALMTLNHGYHAKNANRECAGCHKEHLGKDASITRFEAATFQHRESGFDLSGRHKTLECSRCHNQNKFQVEKTALPSKRGRKTFLGLQVECKSCHGDKHGGSLTANCQQCHSAEGWTPLVAFDHSKTAFHLVAKHLSVDCSKCHESLATTPRPRVLKFSVKSFNDCTPCHKSPHRPNFSAKSCSSCHDPSGWNSTKGFDHSVTRFSLIGKHAGVACDKCHPNMNNRKLGSTVDFSTKKFNDCTPCHSSPHSAELNRSACSKCHSSLAWHIVADKTFDHSRTAFPLRVKHTQLRCEQCHESRKSGSLAVQFRRRSQRCGDCHEDYHQGAFAVKKKDCVDCHSQTSFTPSTYSMKDHSIARFALTGAHRAVRCGECHKKTQGTKQFVFTTLECQGCHQDQHVGIFNTLMAAQGCILCHTTESWNHVEFEHRSVGFELVGRHVNVACRQCHESPSGSPRYKGTPKTCNSCHNDIHGGQFSAGGESSCASCHSPKSWHSLVFDHDRQSAFQLTGAHRNVPCGACHKSEAIGNGKSLVRFKPLSTNCESCHQGRK